MTVSVTSKKKKPKLRPVTMDELTKVFQCLFWASKKSSWIVNRLILSSTEVLKEFLRKHGITILKLLLQELITLYTKCLETNPCNSSEANAKLAPVIQVLKLLDALPITVRNGIDRLEIDKWIEEKCMKLNDNEVNQLSQQLIEKWASLPSVYRIPKKTKVDPPSSTINSSPSYNATTSPKSSSVDEKSPENLPPSQLHPLYSKKNDDQKNNKNSTSAVSPSSSSSSSSSSSHHSSFNTSTHYSNNQYNSSSHSRRRQDSPQRYSSNQTQYYRHHHSQHQHHHPHHHHEPHHRSHLRVHQHSRQRSKSPLFVSEHSNVHRSRPASTNETFSFSSSPSNHNELHPNSSHRTFFSRQLYYQHVPHSRNNKTQRKRSRSPSPGETYHKRSSYFNAGSLNRYHPPAPAPPPAPPLSSSSSSDVFGSHVFHLKSSGSPSKLHPPFSSPPFQSSTKSPPYPRTSSPLHQIKYSVSQSPPPFGLSATSASRARSPVTPKKPTLTGQCNANLLNGYSSSKVYQQMEPPAEEVNLIFSPFQEKQSQREREVLIKELKEKAEQVLKKQPPKHSRPKTVAPVPYTPTTSIPTGSRPPPPLLAELIVKILSREQHVFGNRTEFKEVARKYAHAIFERDPQIVKNGKLSQRAQDKVKKFVQHSLTKMKWTKGIRRTSEKSLSSKDIKSSPKSTTTTPLQSSNSNDPLFIINNDDLLTTSNLASSSLSTALGLSSESSSSSTISFSQVFAPTSPIPLPTHVSQESSDSISTTTLFQSGASPVSPCGMSATTTTTSNSPQMPPFIHYSTSFSSKIVPSTIVEVSPIPSTESKNVVLSPFVSASDPAELRSATSTPPPSAFSSCPSAAFHPTQSPVLSHTSMVGPRLNVTLQDAAILSTPWKSPLSKKKIQNERMDYSRQGTSLPSFSPSSIKDMPSMTSSVSSNVHSSPFSTLPLSSLPVPLPPISKEQTLSSTSTQDQQWAMEIDPKIDQGPCPSLKSFEVHFMPISCGSPKLNGPPSPTPCTTFESWVESSSTSQVFTTRHTHS
ncbi:hypothetical protein HMI54_002308 [Coelomomyces lativittatus]|nr:hypothetical protein HMI54_002308 [Coelomomyces lativittatus]